MKSKDIRSAVKSKFESGDGPTKTFRDLDGIVSLPTIHLWIRILRQTGDIDSSYSPGRSRTVQTKSSISKVKHCLKKAQSF